MKTEVRATVQYGDLVGEIACDGFDAPFFHDLQKSSKCPPEYVPIAVSVSAGESDYFAVHLWACDGKVYGMNIEQIRDVGRTKGNIEVKKFAVALGFKEIMAMVKRLNLVAKNRVLDGTQLVTEDPL